MAVFRVRKTQNCSVMSNHHLRNKALSLKSKGLLSLMLSLPEDSGLSRARGLASICKEGIDSVCATVRELESGAGCVLRRRVRNKDRPDARYGVHCAGGAAARSRKTRTRLSLVRQTRTG